MNSPASEALCDIASVVNKRYENVCRTCLLQQNETRSIFRENIDRMLMQCTTLQVSIN